MPLIRLVLKHKIYFCGVFNCGLKFESNDLLRFTIQYIYISRDHNILITSITNKLS